MSAADGPSGVPPTAFGEPDDESVVPGEQQQRKRLQLTSASGASVGMNASVNRLVARGPDGTRGFALKRSVQRSDMRHRKPTKQPAAAVTAAVTQPGDDNNQRQEHEQQQQLGNQLYAVVSAIHPSLAGKITGMMLGYYDCTALAELLSDRDRLLETVDEAVRLLARAAETSGTTKHGEVVQHNSGVSGSTGYQGEQHEQQQQQHEQQQQQPQQQQQQQPAPPEHEEILLPSSAEPRHPLSDAMTDGAAHKIKVDISEVEVEGIARKHVFQNADWPENYTEEDRQRLCCAVRKEMSGERGLWVASVVLQISRRGPAQTAGASRVSMLQSVYGVSCPRHSDATVGLGAQERPKQQSSAAKQQSRAARSQKLLSAKAGQAFGSVQLAPRR